MSQDTALPSRAIPDHQLLRVIGHGAYGEVWLARNVLGDFRAVKIVSRDAFRNDPRPFEREFEGIRRYEPISRSDPSQVAILHVGRAADDRYFYYVMELADPIGAGGYSDLDSDSSPTAGTGAAVKGINRSPILDPETYAPQTLRAVIREHGTLPIDRVIEIGSVLAGALAHLHGMGLVHRDVKPANIIFVGGRPKLADIGLVTGSSPGDDSRSMVGTEGFLAPEGPGSPGADIFALGKVLYEAATGRDRRDFPDLPQGWPDVPERERLLELNAILLKACANDPRDRYSSVDEIRTDLELMVHGRSVRRRHSWLGRWRMVKRWGIPIGLVTVMTLGATFWFQRMGRPRPRSSNPEALKLYDRAVNLMLVDTWDRSRQAYKKLDEAIALDPNFVDAHYLKFEIFWNDGFAKMLPPHFGRDENIAFIADTLRSIAPRSAQYHTVHSYMLFTAWHFDEAIEEIQQAIIADGSFVRAHGLYAWYSLLSRGDSKTAEREFREAEKHGHLDLVIQNYLGGAAYYERRYDEAIAKVRIALDSEDRNQQGREFLSAFYEAQGVDAEKHGEGSRAVSLYEQSIHEREEARLVWINDSEVKRYYEPERQALKVGPKEWILYRLQRLQAEPHPSEYQLAQLYSRLERPEEMFRYLNLAREKHSYEILHLLEDDHWDPYRGDTNFIEILRQVGFKTDPHRPRNGLSAGPSAPKQ